MGGACDNLHITCVSKHVLFQNLLFIFFQKEKFNENIEEMLTKLEEFCGLVDMVILKQGNFHFIMKSIINIFSVDSIISTE